MDVGERDSLEGIEFKLVTLYLAFKLSGGRSLAGTSLASETDAT